MDFLGPIDGMNFTPITNYNNHLKNNTSFNIDTVSDFESILNKQTEAIQNPVNIQGGIEMNNIDNITAQTNVRQVDTSEPTGHFLNSFEKSIGKGLGSVNDSINAADKAQEAFAMGEDVSVHDVMIAAEKASLSMQMAMQLRNKLMSAYSEISNVRV